MIWGAFALALLSAGVVLRELGRVAGHDLNRVRGGTPEEQTYCSLCGERVEERA